MCVQVLQLDRRMERPADGEHEWRRAKANKRQQRSQREGDAHVLFRVGRTIPTTECSGLELDVGDGVEGKYISEEPE